MKVISKFSRRLIVCLFTSLIGAIALVAPAATNISPPGTILWRFPAGEVTAGPAVGPDGTIYVTAGNPLGKLYALTPAGTKKWETDLGSFPGAPAVAADGTIYVSGYNVFRAFNPDGTLRWSYAPPFTHYISPPAIAYDRTIYFAAGTPQTLYALRPDGTLKWTFEIGEGTDAPIVGADGTIYFGVYYNGFYALHPDGTRKWHYPIDGYNIHGAIGKDGTVYVSGSDTLFALTPEGVKKWEARLGPVAQGASPPVVGADGTIFVRCDLELKVFAFNPDGSTKWEFAPGGNMGGASTSPTIDSQGNIYSGSGFRFYALSPTGSRLWSFTNDWWNTASALTPEGILYFGAGTNVYAVRANAGLGDDPWPMFQHDLRRTGAVPPVDADHDGVPDARDECPETPSGTVVNAQGCGITQLCPCDGNWGSHSEHVRCVIANAWDFYRAGLIDGAKRKTLVAAAARSHCGRRPRSREPLLLHFSPQTRDERRRDGIRVVVAGEGAGRCTVEVSNDLIHWKPLAGETLVGEEIALPISSVVAARFYRVRVSP